MPESPAVGIRCLAAVSTGAKGLLSAEMRVEEAVGEDVTAGVDDASVMAGVEDAEMSDTGVFETDVSDTEAGDEKAAMSGSEVCARAVKRGEEGERRSIQRTSTASTVRCVSLRCFIMVVR